MEILGQSKKQFLQLLLSTKRKNNIFNLVDHKKANLWLPAGGHVEPNEHPRETVKREILEELSIQVPTIKWNYI
ncbi:MAG: NUDIX domain-containing protein [Chlamydiales bacterium]